MLRCFVLTSFSRLSLSAGILKSSPKASHSASNMSNSCNTGLHASSRDPTNADDVRAASWKCEPGAVLPESYDLRQKFNLTRTSRHYSPNQHVTSSNASSGNHVTGRKSTSDCVISMNAALSDDDDSNGRSAQA